MICVIVWLFMLVYNFYCKIFYGAVSFLDCTKLDD